MSSCYVEYKRKVAERQTMIQYHKCEVDGCEEQATQTTRDMVEIDPYIDGSGVRHERWAQDGSVHYRCAKHRRAVRWTGLDGETSEFDGVAKMAGSE